MRAWLTNLIETLRSSFWFVPALLTLTTVLLSFATIAVDSAVRDRLLRHIPLIWIGGIEGARQLLSTIAGSMITVAGVVFSITIVVLALASSQLGPRLLRKFTGNRGHQLVLGTFISTFIYSVLVLRATRDSAQTFVPYISVTLAILLALLSVAVLIYFIHHVSEMIQAPTVIAMVAAELDAKIDELFPEQPEDKSSENGPAENLDSYGKRVLAWRSGYVQFIDDEGLIEIAAKNDLLLRLHCRPGRFVIEGEALLTLGPAERAGEKPLQSIHRSIILGSERTITQDLEFAISQLVEVAVRALSPGINDPFTALSSIDWLAAALCKLAKRPMPRYRRFDVDHKLRLITDPLTFGNCLNAAFDQIIHYGQNNFAVVVRLLDVIEMIAEHARRDADRQVLLDQATKIEDTTKKSLRPSERRAVAERFSAVRNRLGTLGREQFLRSSVFSEG